MPPPLLLLLLLLLFSLVILNQAQTLAASLKPNQNMAEAGKLNFTLEVCYFTDVRYLQECAASLKRFLLLSKSRKCLAGWTLSVPKHTTSVLGEQMRLWRFQRPEADPLCFVDKIQFWHDTMSCKDLNQARVVYHTTFQSCNDAIWELQSAPAADVGILEWKRMLRYSFLIGNETWLDGKWGVDNWGFQATDMADRTAETAASSFRLKNELRMPELQACRSIKHATQPMEEAKKILLKGNRAYQKCHRTYGRNLILDGAQCEAKKIDRLNEGVKNAIAWHAELLSWLETASREDGDVRGLKKRVSGAVEASQICLGRGKDAKVYMSSASSISDEATLCGDEKKGEFLDEKKGHFSGVEGEQLMLRRSPWWRRLVGFFSFGSTPSPADVQASIDALQKQAEMLDEEYAKLQKSVTEVRAAIGQHKCASRLVTLKANVQIRWSEVEAICNRPDALGSDLSGMLGFKPHMEPKGRIGLLKDEMDRFGRNEKAVVAEEKKARDRLKKVEKTLEAFWKSHKKVQAKLAKMDAKGAF
ncbi:hypothetical protein CTRI78_v006559 [Colletotrichum trifolii]|uniref:Uncharacterized protein n=1 Tax=Colletotrichum trifolii TaxID=5466 RepID=A0A4R8RFD3_COLTR|nr:hypothetical protein CTRI78_v006559 [Colletotrichum trifolii]